MQQTSGLMASPFAVLTVIVAPAILTNACSVLALGTGNRIARVVDRTRVISTELATLDSKGARFEARLEQIGRLRVRASLLVRALRMFYVGMGCFAGAVMLTIIGSVLSYYDFHPGFEASAGIALVVGMTGVGALVYGSTLTVRETRLAFALLDEEVGEILREHS